jgi:endonuclease/exonuclease/phosphatase family metal-dependent hydrolase
MRLRVLTWNIHKAIGGLDRRYRPERVTEVLAHYQPDVVLLQEVDEGARRSRHERQVDVFGDALGYEHRAFAVNVTLRTGGGYGNAILSRWPLSQVENVDLTVKPKKRRSALTAQVLVSGPEHQRTVIVANAHLGLAGFERAMQLRRLLGHPAVSHHRRRTPCLVGGDFNDTWGGLGRRFLEPLGFRRAGRPLNTYPAYLPARPLDVLFVRGDLRADRTFRPRLRVAREASDHVPLIAECRIR